MEGDLAAVEAYKSSGGDIARQLTSDEVRLLNRPSAFDDGFTLVHLAIRFQRQDMLAVLLTEVSTHKRPFRASSVPSKEESPHKIFFFSNLCTSLVQKVTVYIHHLKQSKLCAALCVEEVASC